MVKGYKHKCPYCGMDLIFYGGKGKTLVRCPDVAVEASDIRTRKLFLIKRCGKLFYVEI